MKCKWIYDETGRSVISVEDIAVAIADESEVYTKMLHRHLSDIK